MQNSDEITVRTGTPADVHKIMELGFMTVAENGMGKPNPEKLLRDIWPSLNLDGGIVGVVGDERAEAAILLRVEPFWYSDDKVLLERAIFVHPDFRAAKVGRARLLCEFAKRAAQNLGMPLVIGVLSSQRAEAKVRLYTRQFGEPSGAYWIYGATTGAGAQ